KIHEITEKKILKDKKTYEFELINVDWTGLKTHEIKILSGLFTSKTVGSKVSLDGLKDSFYKIIQSLQSDMPKKLTKAGYFTSNPRRAGAGLYVLAVALAVIGFVLIVIAPGFLIAAVIV